MLGKLKRELYGGETTIGCWLNLGSAVVAEVVAVSGYDWAVIDLEHGAGDFSALLPHAARPWCSLMAVSRTNPSNAGEFFQASSRRFLRRSTCAWGRPMKTPHALPPWAPEKRNASAT